MSHVGCDSVQKWLYNSQEACQHAQGHVRGYLARDKHLISAFEVPQQ